MAISKINGIPLDKKVTPVGIIKPQPTRTIEDVELRASLEKAVDDAHLNVTERLALNKQFFPNGGGFNLFPKNVIVPQFTFYYKKGDTQVDEFTREAESIKFPQRISRYESSIRKSNKSCFEKNLENALKKLNKVLQGKI